MKQIVAVAVTLILIGQSSIGWAESRSDESTVEQIGYGTGAVVGSAVYFPFKASFCILGGIGSGFTLIFAGTEKANKVVSTTCRGTWGITPDVVKGKERVKFVGEPAASDTTARAQAR